ELPWQASGPHLLHWLHRGGMVLAVLTAVLLTARAWRVTEAAHARCVATAVLALYALQAVLGAANVLWQPGIARVGHLVLAAVILVAPVALATWSCSASPSSSSTARATNSRGCEP